MTNELVGSRGREARDHCLNEMILVGKKQYNTIGIEAHGHNFIRILCSCEGLLKLYKWIQNCIRKLALSAFCPVLYNQI